MSVETTRGDVVLGSARELFKADVALGDHCCSLGDLAHVPYDVAPDGRFLINERIARAPKEAEPLPRATIVVVTNWLSALGAD